MKNMEKSHKVTIEEADISDVHSLALLSGELGYPATAADMAHRLEAIRSDTDQKVFVARHDFLVGWIHAVLIHSLESEPYAEIRGLVVTEQHRGAGIGTQLVQEAEKWAKRLHCGRIRVRTNIVRAEAHAFYRKLGYVSRKTQSVFDKSITPDE